MKLAFYACFNVSRVFNSQHQGNENLFLISKTSIISMTTRSHIIRIIRAVFCENIRSLLSPCAFLCYCHLNEQTQRSKGRSWVCATVQIKTVTTAFSLSGLEDLDFISPLQSF